MKKLMMILIAPLGMLHCVMNAEAAKRVLPIKAQNMTPLEVRQIYASHTWKWGSGGAYFGPNGSFYAVSGEGKTLSIASGRWLVTKGGRLCFNADWSAASYTSKNIMTCFNHAEYKGNYYQAKGLSGKWDLIKSAKPSPQDLINLVVPGDLMNCLYLDSGKKLKHRLSGRQASEFAKLKESKINCHVPSKPATT